MSPAISRYLSSLPRKRNSRSVRSHSELDKFDMSISKAFSCVLHLEGDVTRQSRCREDLPLRLRLHRPDL